MDHFDDAIENSINLDMSYGNAYKHRGVAYYLKCEYEKAITNINRALPHVLFIVCVMLCLYYAGVRCVFGHAGCVSST